MKPSQSVGRIVALRDGRVIEIGYRSDLIHRDENYVRLLTRQGAPAFWGRFLGGRRSLLSS